MITTIICLKKLILVQIVCFEISSYPNCLFLNQFLSQLFVLKSAPIPIVCFKIISYPNCLFKQSPDNIAVEVVHDTHYKTGNKRAFLEVIL